MSSDFLIIQFAEAKQPEYREKKKEGYMEYGDRNDYPNYLVELFNKSAKHNAIVRNKVHYICGNGWTGNEQFIEKPNRSENLNDLTRKISLDLELFGGAYIEVIWGLGKVAEMWHIDYTKIRTNKDNTQFWYKEDWKAYKKEIEYVYPAFNPKVPNGKQIIYLKEYRPNIGVYSLPVYFGALNYIESDVEVSKHVLGNAKTGFSASKLITLPDGQPSREEMNEIHRKFKNTYTGADGVKYMLSFVNDASRKPIVDDLGQSDLTKEDFGRVDELIQTNIFSGHQVTTPSIFGIAVAGKLGTRTEMRDGYEIFKNTYVNGKQMFLESFMNDMAKYFGYSEEMKIIPCEPIGIEFSEATIKEIAPREWMLEKLGIDMTKYQPVQTAPELNPVELADQFSVFFEFGDEKEGYEVWKQKDHFQDVELFADVTQLQSNILDLISKDKRITPEVIADTLNEDIGAVKRIITDLTKKGFIKSTETSIGQGIDENIIIERQLTEPLRDIVEKVKPKTTEFLIRYSYEWKAGFSKSDIKTSREFCKYLLQANKFYSRSDIEQMSARLGYSVWDRRGGWYTKPNTNIHEPACRHIWKSNIVTRK
ncbi:Winged helix-turn-helix DNA-binding [uncultured Caudovirales phage]|uniref:Winged helix-turn-helix DNA-binding n=1 Tax=uncultured Caudovirales phage TaxID=2100421 RepID=A0A6J5LT30_9CAUD|nr:Winged helix-turn-helix DNA-binding [uncultured Caudovirales phage]